MHWTSRAGLGASRWRARISARKIERYGAETRAYLGESAGGDEATVRTRITLKPGRDVGVDYRMARQDAG